MTIMVTERSVSSRFGRGRMRMRGLGAAGQLDESEITARLPASFYAVALGDLGWYGGPLVRSWTPELEAAWKGFIESEVVGLTEDAIDILAETWLNYGKGVIEGEPRDTVYVGDAGEVLYTLGFYDGPPITAWNEEMTAAFYQWVTYEGDSPSSISVAGNVTVTGSDLNYVRFDAGIWDRLVDEYLATLKAVVMGTEEGIEVSQINFEPEPPTSGQPETTVPSGDQTPAPVPPKPPRHAYAGMLGWGTLVVGGLVGGLYLLKNRKRSRY